MTSTGDELQRARQQADELRATGLEQLRSSLETRALVGPMIDDVVGLAREAMEALDDGRPLNPALEAALDEAIRALRPFVLVGRAGLAPLPPLAAARFPNWAACAAAVRPALGAIGKVSLPGPEGERVDVATGFLVAPRLVATNRHVLEVLEAGTGALVAGQATVAFGQQYEGAEPAAVAIVAVAAQHPSLDVVVLEIGPGAGGTPLALPAIDVALVPGDELATIGFPARPGDGGVLDALLSGPYAGKKRGSPGRVRTMGVDQIDHDCSTAPGSSGSPVFRQRDGTLVGIHYEGVVGIRNGALPVAAVRELVDGLGG